MSREKPSVPLANVANGDICFFTERDWSQEYCHGNTIVSGTLFLLWCTFLVPSLKKTAPNFWRSSWFSILLFKCNHLWRHHFPCLHNTKTWISLKRKKIFQKEKYSSSLLWKAFQIRDNHFLLHRHFRTLLQHPVEANSVYKRDKQQKLKPFLADVLSIITELLCRATLCLAIF